MRRLSLALGLLAACAATGAAPKRIESLAATGNERGSDAERESGEPHHERGDDEHARIDVRSASRYGRHDLGRNADRVRQILKEIVVRMESVVPAVRTKEKPKAEAAVKEEQRRRRRSRRRRSE